MSNAKWLVAAIGLVGLTAGCVQETTTYYPRGTAPQAAVVYTQPQATVVYQGTSPQQSRSDRYWNSASRDADRDGIPNRYDRDANGDRIPDRYQGR